MPRKRLGEALSRLHRHPGRAHELLLGGATFTVLNEMSLPVLLAH